MIAEDYILYVFLVNSARGRLKVAVWFCVFWIDSRCSTVVVHFIGNEEVASPILANGTISRI